MRRGDFIGKVVQIPYNERDNTATAPFDKIFSVFGNFNISIGVCKPIHISAVIKVYFILNGNVSVFL